MENRIRKITLDKISGIEISESDRSESSLFTRYMDAYCSELGKTEFEVILNDEEFDILWGLYKNLAEKLILN